MISTSFIILFLFLFLTSTRKSLWFDSRNLNFLILSMSIDPLVIFYCILHVVVTYLLVYCLLLVKGLITKERKNLDPAAVPFAKDPGQIAGLRDGDSLLEVVSSMLVLEQQQQQQQLHV